MMTIRHCHPCDLQSVVGLNEMVYAALPNKTVLRYNPPATIALCLESPHVTLGVWDKDLLVAIGVMFVPQSLDEDHAHDLGGLVEKATEMKAANQKLYLVREGYRGLGLQRQLIREMEKIATERGFQLLCTTCAPNNTFSIGNFLKEGYHYAKTEEKYGGLVRNVYYKILNVNI